MRSPAVFVANRRLASAHFADPMASMAAPLLGPRGCWLIFIVGDLALEVTTRAYAAYLLPSVGLTLATFAVLGLQEQRSRRKQATPWGTVAGELALQTSGGTHMGVPSVNGQRQ